MSRKWVNSADSHMTEPGDLWSRPLGAKYGDAVPRIFDPGDPVSRSCGLDPALRYYFTGEHTIPIEPHAEFDEEMLARIDRATKDPTFRAQCMDEDGVYAELLLPTKAMFVFSLKNGDLARDCLRVYNDWLAEYCGQEPKRMLGAALIQMEDVALAIAELERNAKRDMRCAMINADTRPEWGRYQDKEYDPFWARMQEMGIPVLIHISTGQKKDMFLYKGEGLSEAARGYLELFAEAGNVVANEFIFGGILDRFPGLSLVLGEFEASWLPHWLFRLEQLANDFGPNLGLAAPARPIREYLSQIYVGVIDDPLIPHVTSVADPNTLIWGSDFPHVRNTHMKTQKVIAEVFGHLDQESIDNITIHNAARLFSIDMPAEAAAG